MRPRQKKFPRRGIQRFLTRHLSLVELPREEPTCDKPGHTSGMSCTMCGAVVFGHTEIPALGHRMENGVCKVCGYAAPTEEESTPENKTGNDG